MMRFRQNLFFFFLAAVAAACLVPLPIGVLTGLSGRDTLALVILVVLGAIAEAMPAQYDVGKGDVSSSVTFVPLFAIILLFGHNVAAVTAFIIFIPTLLFIRHFTVRQIVFNVSQVVVATSVAERIYYLVNDSLTIIPGHQLIAVLMMASSFFVMNASVVTLYLGVFYGHSFTTAFKRIVGPGGSNLYYDILLSPLSLLVAYVYSSMGVIGIAILVMPLYIIRHSYLSMLQLQYATRALLKVLVKAIETRDPYTSGHSVRVSLLAKAIAEDLSLHGDKVDSTETAALLHDIGKVDGVYADLIRKPHSLSSEEVRIIRTHATKGADFLSGLRTFDDFILSGIRHHHEKYDGSGYPHGLSGDLIPLAGRIIQIADSVDAMLSDRPYRPALSLEQVEKELRRCSGTQFDPGIIETMFRKSTLRRLLPLLQEHGANTSASPTPAPDIRPIPAASSAAAQQLSAIRTRS